MKASIVGWSLLVCANLIVSVAPGRRRRDTCSTRRILSRPVHWVCSLARTQSFGLPSPSQQRCSLDTVPGGVNRRGGTGGLRRTDF